VKAIVHSHSPTVIPFGISDVPLRPVFPIWAHFSMARAGFEISEFTQDGEMLVRDARLGDALAKALGAKIVALMPGTQRGGRPVATARGVPRGLHGSERALQTIAVGLGGRCVTSPILRATTSPTGSPATSRAMGVVEGAGEGK